MSLPLIIVAGAVWLAVASSYSRQAVWFLMLWIPVQGWVQLNVFNDQSATVLLYEFQMIGVYAIFAARAAKSRAAFGIPPIARMALPFAVWALLLIPSSIASNGVILTLLGLRTYLLPLPLVWIGYRAFETRRQFETLVWLLMLQLAPIALIAVAQFAQVNTLSGLRLGELPRGFGYAGGVIRPPGTFSSDGHLGMYLLFAIPVALGLLGLASPLSKRAGFAIGLVGATVALMANTQRATIVLLTITLPFIVILARRPNALLKVVVAFALIVMAGALGQEVSGGAFRERIQTISADLHVIVIENPVERMSDALRTPMFGGGLGIASPGATRLDPEPALGWQPDQVRRGSIKPNESFMAALVHQTGVPGLILFYLFIAAILREGLRAVRACRATDVGLLAGAVFMYLIAVLLQSWAYDPLHFPPSRVFFWLWAGILLRLPQLGVAAPALQRIPPGRTLAAVPPRASPAPAPGLARPRVPRHASLRHRAVPPGPGRVNGFPPER